MAKTIITQDGSAVNYDNILAIYVEENTYDEFEEFFDEDSEIEEIEDLIHDEDGEEPTFLLSAETISDVIYVLGEYRTEEDAEIAKLKLIEWLRCEVFGVYSMSENKGDA